MLEGALVSATVVEQSRAPKIIVFKKQRRKNYRRKKGHRQHQTVLRITAITGANSFVNCGSGSIVSAGNNTINTMGDSALPAGCAS